MSFPLYLDENVDVQLAEMLKRAGCDARSALEAGRANQRISDEDQLAFATESGRAIFTHDAMDYAALVAAWHNAGRYHRGVILSRRKATPELYQAFLRLFESHPDGIADLTLWLPATI